MPNVSYALPAAWWLFWWGVGLVATVFLAVWFWRAARRADELTREAQQALHDADSSAARQNTVTPTRLPDPH